MPLWNGSEISFKQFLSIRHFNCGNMRHILNGMTLVLTDHTIKKRDKSRRDETNYRGKQIAARGDRRKEELWAKEKD